MSPKSNETVKMQGADERSRSYCLQRGDQGGVFCGMLLAGKAQHIDFWQIFTGYVPQVHASSENSNDVGFSFGDDLFNELFD